MPGKPKKSQREKDLTSRYLSGSMDEDVELHQGFTRRSKQQIQRKIERTAVMRAAEEENCIDPEQLPIGQVVQVYSLFCDVIGTTDHLVRLCVIRKTLAKLQDTSIVVGDLVRFRETGTTDEQGRHEAVIEHLLPRTTILTRSDSFKATEQHPIVANAHQMLIVASLRDPPVKWGLVDRMIVAARSGGLTPIVCLNKIDLRRPEQDDHYMACQSALAHYGTMGIASLQTSVEPEVGLEQLRCMLAGRTTVLAGHSGVGKSSLIRAIDPSLDLRIGAISGYTGKGRHTTTSARRYNLTLSDDAASPSHVVDTPGVKLFGLWGVTRGNLEGFFPDMRDNSAPEWRRESFQRILDSLPEPQPGSNR